MKAKDIRYNTALELALMVMIGIFGTGSERKKALGSRYDEVQKLVDQIYKSQVIPVSDINMKLDSMTEEMKKELLQ